MLSRPAATLLVSGACPVPSAFIFQILCELAVWLTGILILELKRIVELSGETAGLRLSIPGLSLRVSAALIPVPRVIFQILYELVGPAATRARDAKTRNAPFGATARSAALR